LRTGVNGNAGPRTQPVPRYVERFLGPYLMSRINEDGIVLYFTGGDRRLKKRRSS
jgi:hypothetical protein